MHSGKVGLMTARARLVLEDARAAASELPRAAGEVGHHLDEATIRRRLVATMAREVRHGDVLQHEHYRRNVIDQQPGDRLVRDGALVKDGDFYRLAPPFDQLRQSELLELIAECEGRIENFIESYGDRFQGRNNDPIPGNMRYELLKRAGGRCELCGASHDEVPLDVDHIVPRNKGGSNHAATLG